MRRQGESFAEFHKRFRKAVQQERILSEARRRRYYEKPSVARKRKAAKKLSKSRKVTAKKQRARW
jgi:small subunit ribosomal protein S21